MDVVPTAVPPEPPYPPPPPAVPPSVILVDLPAPGPCAAGYPFPSATMPPPAAMETSPVVERPRLLAMSQLLELISRLFRKGVPESVTTAAPLMVTPVAGPVRLKRVLVPPDPPLSITNCGGGGTAGDWPLVK